MNNNVKNTITPKPKFVRTDYQIFDYQKEKLKILSRQTGYTVSALVRQAIDLLNYE